MAILPNISEQFGVQFEAGHRIDADWWTVRLVMYRYREESNQFENWLAVEPGIHETDLQTLIRKLEAFQDAADESANFDFEPFVEPSFQFTLERIPHNEDYCRVATLAIDMVGARQVQRSERVSREQNDPPVPHRRAAFANLYR